MGCKILRVPLLENRATCEAERGDRPSEEGTELSEEGTELSGP